jgi:hypothetical protein
MEIFGIVLLCIEIIFLSRELTVSIAADILGMRGFLYYNGFWNSAQYQ